MYLAETKRTNISQKKKGVYVLEVPVFLFQIFQKKNLFNKFLVSISFHSVSSLKKWSSSDDNSVSLLPHSSWFQASRPSYFEMLPTSQANGKPPEIHSWEGRLN